MAKRRKGTDNTMAKKKKRDRQCNGQKKKRGRKSRLKNELPMIALAGYTNAGKSTLFNTLTQAEVFADEQLFSAVHHLAFQLLL
jgi:GTP-binding protein HflX